jgi:large subunit ribosomal protein L31
MKKDIHPQTKSDINVTCACGNSFTTISTLEEIKVEICSACHPFFTGQQKFVDTEGRIEKFQKKMAMAQANGGKKNKKGKGKNQSKTSLKDLLKETKEENK